MGILFVMDDYGFDCGAIYINKNLSVQSYQNGFCYVYEGYARLRDAIYELGSKRKKRFRITFSGSNC